MLRHRAFDPAAGRVEIGGRIARGVVNAPPVLVELADRAAAWKVGNPPHVVNLTLLPQTAEDLDFLRSRLGTGNVTLLSRGYGNCRVTATGLRNVWWVQYFNSEDALILNTLEVADIPAVALAAPEDIEDSAKRLAEILETVA
jgi:hydrogenase-1 operon protein HyaF